MAFYGSIQDVREQESSSLSLTGERHEDAQAFSVRGMRKILWGFLCLALVAISATELFHTRKLSVLRLMSSWPLWQSSRSESMSLLLLRHAEAESDRHKADYDRRLTTKGIYEAKWMGRKLRKHRVEPPDLIIASSCERTVQTLAYVLDDGWASHCPIVYSNELFDFAGRHADCSYLNYLVDSASANAAFRRILLVGHNPALEDLYRDLSAHRRHDTIASGTLVDLKLESLDSWSNLASQLGRARVDTFLKPKTRYFRIHPSH